MPLIPNAVFADYINKGPQHNCRGPFCSDLEPQIISYVSWLLLLLVLLLVILREQADP